MILDPKEWMHIQAILENELYDCINETVREILNGEN